MSGPSSHDLGRSPLRYRRFGGGYRREDVDLLLTEMRLKLHSLELEVERLRAGGGELHAASTKPDAIDPDTTAEIERRAADAERRLQEANAERDRLFGELGEVASRLGGLLGAEPSQNGHSPAEQVDRRDSDSTRVDLDAGPFEDFDSAAGFERRLAELDDVQNAHLRYLHGHRAAIELVVAAGAPLVARMRERLPYELEVRDQSLDRLVIDLTADS